MNFLDALFIIPLLYAAYKGFKHGFVIEIFTLLAFFVGIYAAVNFSDYAAEKIQGEFELDQMYLAPTAFAVTFLVVGALVFFAGKALEQLIKVAALSPLNKGAGALFGFLKMAYILSIALVIVESYDEKKRYFKEESTSTSLLYQPLKELGMVTVPGLKESQIFIENAWKNEADSAGLSIHDLFKAKKAADSLGIDVEDAKTIKKIHDQHVAN